MQPKRSPIVILIICQAILSGLETWLISKISLIGRVGIATIHKEYRLLRSGWKTFLLLFGIQLAIILVLNAIQKRYTRKISTTASFGLLFAAVLGMLITFWDFMDTYTHRLLKERFHLGFYLFWIGWMCTCLYFLLHNSYKKTEETQPFPLDPNTPNTSNNLNTPNNTRS